MRVSDLQSKAMGNHAAVCGKHGCREGTRSHGLATHQLLHRHGPRLGRLRTTEFHDCVPRGEFTGTEHSPELVHQVFPRPSAGIDHRSHGIPRRHGVHAHDPSHRLPDHGIPRFVGSDGGREDSWSSGDVEGPKDGQGRSQQTRLLFLHPATQMLVLEIGSILWAIHSGFQPDHQGASRGVRAQADVIPTDDPTGKRRKFRCSRCPSHTVGVGGPSRGQGIKGPATEGRGDFIHPSGAPTFQKDREDCPAQLFLLPGTGHG